MRRLNCLQKAAKDSANIKLTVKQEDIAECTNPRKLVETYKVQGGPSPVEVERVLALKTKNLAISKADIAKLERSLVGKEKALDATVQAYSHPVSQ